MNEKVAEQISETGENVFKAWRKLGDVSAELIRRMTEVQLQVATLGVEGSVEQLKLVTTSANYKDLLSAEAKFADTYGSKVIALVRETVDVLTESRDELAGWLDDSVKDAANSNKGFTAAQRGSAKKAAA